MKTNLFLSLFAIIVAVQTVNAQQKTETKTPSVSELISQGIFERSPLGRYEKKDYSRGVKSFRSEPRCVLDDLKTVFLMQNPPMKVRIPELGEVFKDSKPTERTKELSMEIKTFEQELDRHLTKQLNIFVSGRDPQVESREICLTSAVFESPNAISIGYGFMAFDPQIFFQLARNEDFNEWAVFVVMAHELTHQFQVWHRDPTLFRTKGGKPFARDKELQADCAAVAIVDEIHRQMPQAEQKSAVELTKTMASAFTSLGDFELSQVGIHHGTAYERSLMIQAGRLVAQKLKEKREFDSANLLKGCLAYIDKMNAKYGDELWPFASPLETP